MGADDAVHDGQAEADAGVFVGAYAFRAALEGFGEATSMTAIRLATRLCRELGRPVTEEDVLECRSVGALLDRLAVRGEGP